MRQDTNSEERNKGDARVDTGPMLQQYSLCSVRRNNTSSCSDGVPLPTAKRHSSRAALGVITGRPGKYRYLYFCRLYRGVRVRPGEGQGKSEVGTTQRERRLKLFITQ